jgi:exonuclease VII small subunit
MSDTLAQIEDKLTAQIDNLRKAFDAADDETVREQLAGQIEAMNERVLRIENMEFNQESAELDKSLSAIDASNVALDKSIRSIKSAADVVAKTADFLKYVDQAIEIAATLMK